MLAEYMERSTENQSTQRQEGSRCLKNNLIVYFPFSPKFAFSFGFLEINALLINFLLIKTGVFFPLTCQKHVYIFLYVLKLTIDLEHKKCGCLPGWVAQLVSHPDTPKLWVQPPSGHILGSTNECMNEWNNKMILLFISKINQWLSMGL